METDNAIIDSPLSEKKLSCSGLSRKDPETNQQDYSGKNLVYDVRSHKITGCDHLSDMLCQQRKFAVHLMSSQEEERTAIAREMHEDLGQILATIQMNVMLMSHEYGDHDKFVARADAIERLISESMVKVQNIASGLRPVMLDLLGLSDAMEWYAQKFHQTTGISCIMNVHLNEKRVNHELSSSVFRIFQEVLTNITRHSNASSVQVDLTDRKGFMVLLVRDDGRGISDREKKDSLSFGIEAMRQRAEAFGGKLRIFGINKRGTALIARIPINLKEDRHARQNNSRR